MLMLSIGNADFKQLHIILCNANVKELLTDSSETVKFENIQAIKFGLSTNETKSLMRF